MKLQVATEADSERLKEFFSRAILPGAVDLSFDRQGSFFAQYKMLGDQARTLIMLNEQDQIEGMASLLFSRGKIGGEEQNFAYATDLRIAQNRTAILHWSQLFLPELERLRQEHSCRFVFSSIEQYENQAYNALIRPQHARRKIPRYFLLRQFLVVSVHGWRLGAPKPLPSIRVEAATANDLERLCQFLNEKAEMRPLARIYSSATFLQYLNRWPGLSLGDFLIAKGPHGEWLGVTAPWSPKQVQTYRAHRYHGFAATLYTSLKLGSWLRMVRPLPEPGEPFSVRYLSHLRANSPEVFLALLRAAEKRLARGELMTYVHFRGDLNLLPPEGIITSALPYGFYTVMPPQADLPDFLEPNVLPLPPDFEAAFI